MKSEVKKMIEENEARNRRIAGGYNPLTGEGGCGARVEKRLEWEPEAVMLPEPMVADPQFASLGSRTDYVRLRARYDFEFWAASCVSIHDKLHGGYIPFVLNRPQRRVLAVIEEDRLACRPLRLILLKARQWGGSTLIQMYFAWIQCVLRRSWHSLICAHVRGTAAQIRGMYTRMLMNYPDEFWDEETRPQFKPFEGMQGMRVITGRDCQVTIASSFAGDSVRGLDYALAHLSEVAFWKDTDRMSPEEFVRAICGGIPLVPLSFVALESTADGVGGFFHREWLRACRGESAWRPVFVPWYEIEHYRAEVASPEQLVESFSDYERRLWDRGITLEQIAWYRCKSREVSNPSAMKSEYPSDADEAFVATGAGVFSSEAVGRMRQGTLDTLPARGDMAADGLTGAKALSHVRFVADAQGAMEVWARPAPGAQPRDRYVVAVDIGGRTAAADWSVIAVLDRMASPRPAIVAQWRGHCDHDLLGWRAAMVARWYADALLVVESNTLESEREGASRYILEEISAVYPNLYVREVRDTVSNTVEHRFGFHTNRATKSMAITNMIAAVREGAYTERSVGACDEMAVYEQRRDGSYGAKPGYHDDMVMTRAIALYVASTLPAPVPLSRVAFPLLPRW